MRQDTLTRWTAENSAELYSIRNWGSGYFDISPGGEVIVRPNGPRSDVEVSLMHLIDECHARELNMPVLLRFSNILASRIEEINESFRRAIRDAGYQGEYRGVFPIKVNQQCEIVQDIVSLGRDYPAPVVDHAAARARTLARFQVVARLGPARKP